MDEYDYLYTVACSGSLHDQGGPRMFYRLIYELLSSHDSIPDTEWFREFILWHS